MESSRYSLRVKTPFFDGSDSERMALFGIASILKYEHEEPKVAHLGCGIFEVKFPDSYDEKQVVAMTWNIQRRHPQGIIHLSGGLSGPFSHYANDQMALAGSVELGENLPKDLKK